MERISLFAIGIVMAFILSGCGSPGSILPDDDTQQRTEGSVPGGSGTGNQEESGQVGALELESMEGALAPEGSVEGTAEQENPMESTQPQAATSAEVVELSGEEEEFFTEFIQERDNYGFLLSAYEAREEVDLSEVLYTGAGFGEPIPEEDIPLYLTAVQHEFLETDCLKFARQDIGDFLQRKLGIGLEDIRTSFEWLYIPETDSYYHEAGDSNYVRFTCVEGTRQGDIYTLHFAPEEDWAYGYSDCEAVLVQTEGDYHFLSNRTLAE